MDKLKIPPHFYEELKNKGVLLIKDQILYYIILKATKLNGGRVISAE